MTTCNLNDFYMADYGHVASFNKIESSLRCTKPMTKEDFIDTISRLDKDLILFSERRIVFKGISHYPYKENKQGCIVEDPNFDKINNLLKSDKTRRLNLNLVYGFFNIMKPTRFVDELEDIMMAWEHIARKPKRVTAEVNVDSDIFARMYKSLGIKFLLREDHKWNGLNSYAARKALNAKRYGVSAAIKVLRWREKIPYRLAMSDVKRLLRAPYEVRVAALCEPKCSQELYSFNDKTKVNTIKSLIKWDAVADLIKDKDAMHLLLPKKHVWQKEFNRIPNSEMLIAKIENQDIKYFDFPAFQKAEKLMKADKEVSLASENKKLNLEIRILMQKYFTKGNMTQYVKYMHKTFDMSLYELFMEMPNINYGKEIGNFLLKAKDSKLSRVYDAMHAWHLIPEDKKKGNLADLFSFVEKSEEIIINNVYKENNYPISDFKKMKEKWQNELSLLQEETIPSVKVENKGYVMSKLKRDDIRGLFLGSLTDCCQHIYGVGSTCAWHGATDPDGGFYVIEKKGKIIAESWIWKLGSTLVFDNIEALSGFHNNPTITTLYSEISHELLKFDGIKEVRVGGGYSDIVLPWPKVNSISTPRNCYTDASVQYLIARAEA